MSANIFGSLSVFLIVSLPSGRSKRVSLASIPCEYAEREAVFSKFTEDNRHHLVKAALFAEFVMREPVYL